MKQFFANKTKQWGGPWRWLAAGLLAACTVSTHAQQQGFGGGGGGASTTTRTYPSNTQVGEALITSDPQTRSLIIVTDEATNEDIKRVLQSLDRPKPQALINVRLPEIGDWRQNLRLVEEATAVEAELGGQGRVLIRASGTEPVLRVMVEARDDRRARTDAERLATAAAGG